MEIDKSNQELYQKEFNKSISIFEKSFDALHHSNFEAQKKTYEKAMDEALKAMQDSASALMNQKLLSMKNQLETDFHAYVEDPNQENEEKVRNDINELKGY